MTEKTTAQLRLHFEESDAELPALPLAGLAPLLQGFTAATGWQLRYEPSTGLTDEVWAASLDDGSGQNPGQLILAAPGEEAIDAAPPIDLSKARPLALGVASLLREVNSLRGAVRQREAELAAGVPVATRPDEGPHLADRLEAVLKSGAQVVNCEAAGLYLLDEATSELKLRACFGLPAERLLAPARPLRGAAADLEALVGHAVVLEDTAEVPHWRCPEDFPAAVCLPVSTPTVPLGTLWMFGRSTRDFSFQETSVLEIVAGRLAADLEREMLLAAAAAGKQRDRQSEAAAAWLADRLPSVKPLLDDYEIAGWTQQAESLGGDFHDWSVLADGRLSLVVGDAEGRHMQAALGAASLHAAVRSHVANPHSAAELLGRVNEVLLTASPGDQRAALAYALVEPDSGEAEIALAGHTAAIVVRGDGFEIIQGTAPSLGEMPEAAFRTVSVSLAHGQSLALLTSGVAQAHDAAGARIDDTTIAAHLAKYRRETADGQATRLRRLLSPSGQATDDMSAVVFKRRLR